MTWNWGAQIEILGFDPSQDRFDFTSLGSDSLMVAEVEGDLVFEVANNGGHKIVVRDTQAEDLTLANLTADDWNPIADSDSAMVESLLDLGFDPIA